MVLSDEMLKKIDTLKIVLDAMMGAELNRAVFIPAFRRTLL